MNFRALLSLSFSALALGGSLAGCVGGGDHVAALGDAAPRADAARAATRYADRASRALARGRAEVAVRFAEQAVAALPRQADHRLLLGRSYLKAGRFVSARAAFADVLRLDPDDGKAALDMALAQIGLGDWSGARETLDLHARLIPAADRGLAMALAGDPVGAVEVLMAAARSSVGDVKTRQNLALALALAGRWLEARAVAATDLPPADVDARMAQWAVFARPEGAADQVAALLGVVPVVDAGQPAALALVVPVPPVPAAPVPSAPAKLATTDEPVPPAPAATPPAADGPAPPSTPPIARPAVATIQPIPAERRPIVRHSHARRLAAATTHPVRWTPSAAAGRGGDWHVQVGAFRTAAVAQDGWARAIRRDAALRDHLPQAAAFRASFGPVYRLSVGGFARGEADAMCRRFRARGGACFVRTGAGDQVAAWARRDVQVAAR